MSYLDNFQFFDAPLKLLSVNGISARNSAISGCSGAFASIAPFFPNKVTIAQYEVPWSSPRGQAASMTFAVDTSISRNGQAGIGGTFAPIVNSPSDSVRYNITDIVKPYTARNPVFYFEYATLRDFLKNNFASDLTTIKHIIRSYPFMGYANSDLRASVLVTLDSGLEIPYTIKNDAFNAIRVKKNNTTVNFLPEDDYSLDSVGDWVVITKFSMFDADDLPRLEFATKYRPTVFINAAQTWALTGFGTADLNKYGKEYLTSLTSVLAFDPKPITGSLQIRATGTTVNFLPLLGDIYTAETYSYITQPRNGIATRITGFTGSEDIRIFAVTTGDEITISNSATSVYYPDDNLFTSYPYGFAASTGSGVNWGARAQQNILCFRSIDAFKNLCADFGIIVTNSLNDAKNMPTDFFPDEGGGTVPDGGASSGFPTNPIPNIPAYPDNTTDIITETPPNVSALSSAGVYALNVTQSKEFLKWLMSDDYTQNISNLFNDKLSAVGDLKILPFDIAAHDPLHAIYSDTLTVGNVTGNVANYRISDAYNTWISGGEYTYTAYYGDFNDYDKCSYALFIPYAGIVELNAGDVVNKTLKLSYAVDLLTGNATAVIYSNGVIIKTTSATMGVSVPITSTNTNQRHINNALTALSVGNGVLGGVISSVGSGSPLAALNAIRGGLVQGISNDMSNPLVTQHTGSFGNGTGLSLSQTAFLIITRQIIAMPTDYKKIVGMPATYRGKISEFVGSGFVSISADKIDISCTQVEREEILSALSRGIYL